MKGIVFFLLLMLGQQPAKISIQGVVTTAGTNEPIAGAQLTLSKRTGDPLVSDSRGRFEFKDLDPGEYFLSIVANGYVRQDGPATSSMTIRLTPAGTISGRILEMSGRPAANVPVELLQRAYFLQGRSLRPTARAQTNDLGEYRFFGVTPGRYHVAAGHESASEVQDTFETTYFDSLVLNGRNDVEIAYGYTSGPALEILPGARIQGLDFNISRMQTYRIRGRVLDSSTGRPPSRIDFTGIPGGGNPSYDSRTGAFEYTRVAPGRHAFAQSFEGRRASAIVVVGNSDVEGLSLTLEPEPIIKGQIRVEGATLSDIGLGRTRVNLRSKDSIDSGGGSDPIEMDGSFMLQNIDFPVVPYRVQMFALPSGFYIKEARLNGVDVLNEFALFSRPGNLDIVVSSRVGQVKGVTKAGAQVVLIPDRLRSRNELYKATIADGSGRFTLPNVEPGDYKLFAWERVEPFAYTDAEFIAPFEPQGKKVQVGESSEQSVELSVIPAGVVP
jgi:hypothetical protein